MRHSLVLSGLDGSNPLAFLAALGTCRVLSLSWPKRDVKMSWAVQSGMWSPTIHSGEQLDQAVLTQALFDHLERDVRKHPIAFMETMRGAKPTDVRQMVRERALAAISDNRADLDWLSAMCSDLATEATSQLQIVRRDYVWGNLESVMQRNTVDHLRRTLFEPWDYADPLDNQSLHIEPSEDRRHAHQWYKPSEDPTRKDRGGMLGANRLAIESFPLFQSIAVGDKLATRGFTGVRRDDTRWTWPIWSCRVSIEAVPSLLALADLQSERTDNRALSARGIVTAFRCRRILVGKTPNFTPAMSV